MTSLYRDATDVRLVFHVIFGHDAVAAHVRFVALRERFVNDALNTIENRPGATHTLTTPEMTHKPPVKLALIRLYRILRRCFAAAELTNLERFEAILFLLVALLVGRLLLLQPTLLRQLTQLAQLLLVQRSVVDHVREQL